jgi:hypothetical protein
MKIPNALMIDHIINMFNNPKFHLVAIKASNFDLTTSLKSHYNTLKSPHNKEIQCHGWLMGTEFL